MEEKLISIETAKLAKEKGLPIYLNISGEITGYNLKNKTSYPSSYRVFQTFPSDEEWLYAPTQSLLQKWLREEYNIDITIVRSFGMNKSYHYILLYNLDYDNTIEQSIKPNRSYEDALEFGLQEALKLI